MGIYSVVNEGAVEEVKDVSALMESFIFDELSLLTDEKKQEFIASEDCKVMMEKGLINKRTIVRLNKTDDLSRRMKMAAFQLAKEKEDPLWALLVKNRIKERDLINKIVQRYGNGASRSAKLAQREYLSQSMSSAFMRPSVANSTKDR